MLRNPKHYFEQIILGATCQPNASCIWGETFPEMLGFLEQLGCTQPQRPLPLQKGRTRIVLLSMLIS